MRVFADFVVLNTERAERVNLLKSIVSGVVDIDG